MPDSKTNSGNASELLVELRRDSAVSLHHQIEASIRERIRSGRLRPGTALPPTRTLAADIGVSRGVVVEAYEQLVAEGYLTSRSGGYTRVAAGPEPAPATTRPAPASAPTPRIDFGYGRSDVSSFPRAAWLRSMRRALTQAPNDRFGYSSGHGVPELREALAAYLNRVRGTAADPDNIVICNGYAQGLALLIQVLAQSGGTRLAVEDPSDDDARRLAASEGLDVVGVPVDHNGIRIDALGHADAVVLTPSHQWPTGVVISAESRAAVLQWAKRHRALIIEDDYDAEFRYDRAPIGALQGLAPDKVIYAGSASKTLAPGLRVGWMVVPPQLVDRVTAAKIQADRGSPALDQLAFADFLSCGEFDRHLRRMRTVYRQRRDALLTALREHLPDLEPAGIAAGMHLVTWLPPELDETAIVASAARRGLGINGVMSCRVASQGPGGLIFGYATLNERAINEGIAILATVIDGMRPGRSVPPRPPHHTGHDI